MDYPFPGVLLQLARKAESRPPQQETRSTYRRYVGSDTLGHLPDKPPMHSGRRPPDFSRKQSDELTRKPRKLAAMQSLAEPAHRLCAHWPSPLTRDLWRRYEIRG